VALRRRGVLVWGGDRRLGRARGRSLSGGRGGRAASVACLLRSAADRVARLEGSRVGTPPGLRARRRPPPALDVAWRSEAAVPCVTAPTKPGLPPLPPASEASGPKPHPAPRERSKRAKAPQPSRREAQEPARQRSLRQAYEPPPSWTPGNPLPDPGCPPPRPRRGGWPRRTRSPAECPPESASPATRSAALRSRQASDAATPRAPPLRR
jgi:hypothetical protein